MEDSHIAYMGSLPRLHNYEKYVYGWKEYSHSEYTKETKPPHHLDCFNQILDPKDLTALRNGAGQSLGGRGNGGSKGRKGGSKFGKVSSGFYHLVPASQPSRRRIKQ